MLPKCTKSSTNTPKPNRATAVKETQLPGRPKLRSYSKLPKCKKSSTDTKNTDPNRDRPRTEPEPPSQAKLRSDSALPKGKKSRSDIELPNREKLRSDSLLPNCTNPNEKTASQGSPAPHSSRQDLGGLSLKQAID